MNALIPTAKTIDQKTPSSTRNTCLLRLQNGHFTYLSCADRLSLDPLSGLKDKHKRCQSAYAYLSINIGNESGANRNYFVLNTALRSKTRLA